LPARFRRVYYGDEVLLRSAADGNKYLTDTGLTLDKNHNGAKWKLELRSTKVPTQKSKVAVRFGDKFFFKNPNRVGSVLNYDLAFKSTATANRVFDNNINNTYFMVCMDVRDPPSESPLLILRPVNGRLSTGREI
jgi:hypothetical protein